jgi:hypothetical protein
MFANIDVHSAKAVLTLLIFALAVTAAGSVRAHEVRYIASFGDNANPCTRTAPCLTLQRGINRTPAGGELIILDSSDYGNNGTITKSITISAIGVSATLGAGIMIDATNGTVVLRGLRIKGDGTGGSGIQISTGESVHVHIDDCEIEGFDDGIHVNSDAYPAVFVANTVARNNGNTGLYFRTGSPGRLVVDNSRFEHNGDDGIEVRTGEASITRSVVSGNGGDGVVVTFNGKANITWTTAEHNGGSGYVADGSVQITMEQSVARGNAEGVRASAGSGSTATVRISNSVVTNNGVDLSETGTGTPTLLSRRNNTIGDGTFTVLSPLGGI